MKQDFDGFVDTALALFPAQDAPAAPLPAETWGAINVRWTRYKGVRRPCSSCIALIHEKGVGGAPPAANASWKRIGPNGDTFECNLHGQARRELDDAAERTRKERLAQQEHAAGRRVR